MYCEARHHVETYGREKEEVMHMCTPFLTELVRTLEEILVKYVNVKDEVQTQQQSYTTF